MIQKFKGLIQFNKIFIQLENQGIGHHYFHLFLVSFQVLKVGQYLGSLAFGQLQSSEWKATSLPFSSLSSTSMFLLAHLGLGRRRRGWKEQVDDVLIGEGPVSIDVKSSDPRVKKDLNPGLLKNNEVSWKFHQFTFCTIQITDR